MRVNADMVRRLAALGLSADQLAGVVSVIEEEAETRLAAKREGNRVRQAKSRASRSVTRDSDGVTRDTPSPQKESFPPSPPFKE
ncbi:hypothetical protein, partial [Aureimonas sp. D3]|uniref:hypothetical protein n=1 Tax=Aureimonas sp. D3 TaxID=1638164 RepID=UPI000AEAAC9A